VWATVVQPSASVNGARVSSGTTPVTRARARSVSTVTPAGGGLGTGSATGLGTDVIAPDTGSSIVEHVVVSTGGGIDVHVSKNGFRAAAIGSWSMGRAPRAIDTTSSVVPSAWQPCVAAGESVEPTAGGIGIGGSTCATATPVAPG